MPRDLLDGFSIAAGIIEPRLKSKIHIMPFVTQVTFVRQGELKVCMKAEQDDAPYTLTVKRDQTIVTEPGTFFQLINETEEPCEVLYIVSPAYLFEQLNGEVVYDDSVVLDEDWNTLELNHWQYAAQVPTIKQRQKVERRLVTESKNKFQVK